MSSQAKQPKRPVAPDPVDFRDRIYLPSVVRAPAPKHDSLASLDQRLGAGLPVLDQGNTNACTGFALANVVNYLRRVCGLEPDADISAFMLYSMARRYDEFPGSAKKDSGSSVRGALKGWFRHGAAAAACWSNDHEAMPPPNLKHPDQDWWFDAVNRPLGAYYRIEGHSIPDIHVALSEVGVAYASAICHGGWDAGFEAKPPQGRDKHRHEGEIWEIPLQAARPDDGGHAFLIYGYDSAGFLILNSWGEGWGTAGRARLRYEDWTANAMDCWVAQLGVVTREHLEVAEAGGLRVKAGKVTLSQDAVLRDREIAPFVIDMENNGRLSDSGRFRTHRDDIQSLLTDLVRKARADWKLAPTDPIDVAIYAHGGLTSEDGAAETAARWIPALYQNRIFPIFFFWETDLMATLANMVDDALTGQPRPTAGVLAKLGDWWDRRLERLLARPGTAVWGEMKENGAQISLNPQGGAQLLYSINAALKPRPLAPATTRLHLIGHSAGAIVHCHLASRLATAGWRFETVSFMAPAVRVDVFERTLLPQLQNGNVGHYLQLHLQDTAEQQDTTCRPILGYGRSLLYLVSESFEGGKRTPILGMETYFAAHVAPLALANVKAQTPADLASAVATHGGFDDDNVVRAAVIKEIRRGAPAPAVGSGRPTAARRAGRSGRAKPPQASGTARRSAARRPRG